MFTLFDVVLAVVLISVCFFYRKKIRYVVLSLTALGCLTLLIGKYYQTLDSDPDRGAIPIAKTEFGESATKVEYLKQGWDESDSLWFYNVTQGSALLPYDFYLSLEGFNTQELARSPETVDSYRYLPQKKTFFNPDALAVGFVKDTYQGKEYMGYTCAACHTSQVNYGDTAIRIDGGPAMADMVGYLEFLQKSLDQTIGDTAKNKRFVDAVLELDNDYDDAEQVKEDLQTWTDTIKLYNTVNHSHIDYGYARLDAFGRIYNRVLQYSINREQAFSLLTQVTSRPSGKNYLVTDTQAEKVLDGVDEVIIGNDDFVKILARLQSKEPGYPGLSTRHMLRIRNTLFNEPNAPVSYPFLWDIAQSDYVQWNGVAANAGVGPIGRNTGEVIGVFGILDWTSTKPGWSISSLLSGQKHKKHQVEFTSSIDLTNLKRIESHLGNLQSPQWPEDILGKINHDQAKRGRKLYSAYCQSCHELVDRSDLDRIIIGKFSSVEAVGTDVAMAYNSTRYTGKSGNFKHTFQSTDAGDLIIEEDAPVVQILTSVTKGVVGTPDPDKGFFRRWADWLYTLLSSYFSNHIPQASMKAGGNYNPDTTANPYASLVAYKARSLNGIWATAPYLHNGSVPTLYDLLLPTKKEGDPEGEGYEYRPETFQVGSREFDPDRVGFISQGYDGFEYKTIRVGDMNDGHEYAAGNTAQIDGKVLQPLTKEQRMDLLEFMKTL